MGKCINVQISDWEWNNCKSSHSEVLCIKGAPKHFAEFTGKHLFFNKVTGLKPAILLKRDSSARVFLCILRNFKDHLPCKISVNGYFCIKGHYIRSN